jgi:hypothetical protein
MSYTPNPRKLVLLIVFYNIEKAILSSVWKWRKEISNSNSTYGTGNIQKALSPQVLFFVLQLTHLFICTLGWIFLKIKSLEILKKGLYGVCMGKFYGVLMQLIINKYLLAIYITLYLELMTV